MIWIWLAAMVVFLAVEAATMGLTSIWFALGAFTAFISSALHAPVWLQCLCFIVVSAVVLALVRPLARKYLDKAKQKTNADRTIGECGTVTQRIDNRASTGQVSVGGRVWSARSESDEPIDEGTEVNILRIEGVKVIVKAAVVQKV